MKQVMILLMIAVISASFSSAVDLMSLQGQVTSPSGSPSTGNLTVLIYNSSTNGTPIYNSSTDFYGAIKSGRYDVLLGSGQQLSLVYGNIYYMDLQVNGEDLSFNGTDRQQFESNMGDIKVLHNNSNIASGNYALAGGYLSRALGDYSLAFGYNTTASRNYSFAVGEDTLANGYGSFASGERTVADGENSFAVGEDTLANGYGSFASGAGNVASGESSFAAGGIGTWASGDYSFTSGYLTIASGYRSFAAGDSTTASGDSSFVAGEDTVASGSNSFAFGQKIIANGANTFGIGLNSTAYNITQANTMAIMGGFVGIGTVSPNATLDVNGTVSINSILRLVPTDVPSSCGSSAKGSMYMDDSLSRPCFCNGSAWVMFNDSVTTC